MIALDVLRSEGGGDSGGGGGGGAGAGGAEDMMSNDYKKTDSTISLLRQYARNGARFVLPDGP